MLRWIGYAFLSLVAFVILANLFGPGTKESFQRSAPSYAAAMTDDYAYDTCVVNTANRLRATRSDFLAMAQMACGLNLR